MLRTTYFLTFISLSNRYQVGDASIMRKSGVYALLAQNGQNSTKTKNSTKLKVVCHRFVQIYIIWEKSIMLAKVFIKAIFQPWRNLWIAWLVLTRYEVKSRRQIVRTLSILSRISYFQPNHAYSWLGYGKLFNARNIQKFP